MYVLRATGIMHDCSLAPRVKSGVTKLEYSTIHILETYLKDKYAFHWVGRQKKLPAKMDLCVLYSTIPCLHINVPDDHDCVSAGFMEPWMNSTFRHPVFRLTS